MAFGGNAGAAAGMIARQTLRIPYATGLAEYDSASRAQTTAPGTQGIYAGDPGQQIRNQFDSLDLFMVQQGQASIPLAAFVDQSVNGSAADTGILVTGVPGAGQHGIPTNFGPGRGNWFLPDLARFDYEIFYCALESFGNNQSWPTIVALTLLGGNVSLVFKNQSSQNVTSLGIRLHYNHSLEM